MHRFAISVVFANSVVFAIPQFRMNDPDPDNQTNYYSIFKYPMTDPYNF